MCVMCFFFLFPILNTWNEKNDAFTFFNRIPKDKEKSEEWREAILPHVNLENLNGMICINHFFGSDFVGQSSEVVLKTGVVPSIFDVICNEPNEPNEPDLYDAHDVNLECQNVPCISLRLQMDNERKDLFIERMKRDVKIAALEHELKTLRDAKEKQSEHIKKLDKKIWHLLQCENQNG